MTQDGTALPRTYAVRTLGCQMNEHDSERMAGLLEQAGLVPVEKVPEAAARATDAGAWRRRYRHQHMLRARERRDPTLRQPRPARCG